MNKNKTARFFAGSFLLLGGGSLCLENFLVYLCYLSYCGRISFKSVRPSLLRDCLYGLSGSHNRLYKIAEYEGGLLVCILMGIVFLLICIGFFTGKLPLITVGSAGGILVRAFIAFVVFYDHKLLPWDRREPDRWLQNSTLSQYLLLHFLCFALFFLFLFLASRNKRTSKKLCFLASGALVLWFVFMVVSYRILYQGQRYNLNNIRISVFAAIATSLLLLAGTVFSGKALAAMAPEKNEKSRVLHSNVGRSEASDPLEMLAKLKQSLDDGVITQEEFDAKKKQLLGL